MNELDEIYLRSLSYEALGGDPTALNAVKWDRTSSNDAGMRVGHDDMTGQQFVLGAAELPPSAPQINAPQKLDVKSLIPAPPGANTDGQATELAKNISDPEDDGNSFGKFLGDLGVFLNSSSSELAGGVARFVGNSAGAFGLIPQGDVESLVLLINQ